IDRFLFQRLVRPKVGGFEVFYAGPVKKWGLRTTMQNKHIDEDTPLFEYGGELLEDDDKPVAKDDYIFTFEYVRAPPTKMHF
uniref:Ubiquitin-like domain-containing protein n=1 Tax=Globodera pallida TaxID=36090 RepID=A0A183CTR8_GLOPA